MRFFKIASLVMLLALTPQTGYCQLGKGVSQVFKSILKKGGKEAGEEPKVRRRKLARVQPNKP